jgi:hypothetical protein
MVGNPTRKRLNRQQRIPAGVSGYIKKRHMDRLLIIISLNLIFAFNVYSEQDDSLRCHAFIDTLTNNEYYRVVDSMPEYPGGRSAMVDFFMSNFNYKETEAFGRIIIEFIVDEKGKMTDFKLLRGLIDIMDNEAIRVMKLMPNWIPGKCGNETVNVKLIIPWIIRLE